MSKKEKTGSTAALAAPNEDEMKKLREETRIEKEERNYFQVERVSLFYNEWMLG